MPIPPQFKKSAKRRLDQALPSNTAANTKKGGVATFKNPGNKAGAGLMQQAAQSSTEPSEGAATEAKDFMTAIKSAPKKKPKTTVQPAVARRLMAMRMAAGK